MVLYGFYVGTYCFSCRFRHFIFGIILEGISNLSPSFSIQWIWCIPFYSFTKSHFHNDISRLAICIIQSLNTVLDGGTESIQPLQGLGLPFVREIS